MLFRTQLKPTHAGEAALQECLVSCAEDPTEPNQIEEGENENTVDCLGELNIDADVAHGPLRPSDDPRRSGNGYD